MIGSDIRIKKTAWVGVLVGIKEKKGKTHVRVTGYSPSVWSRLIIKPWVASLFIGKKWRKVEDEVEKVLSSQGIISALNSTV